MVLFILLVGLLLICLFLKIWCDRYRFENNLKGFVTPPGLPLLRHSYLFASESTFATNLQDIVNKNGTLLKMEVFYGMPFLLVTDKDFINHILTVKPIIAKGIGSDMCKKFTGDGLATCGATKWRKSRKILNPAFNAQLLEEYVEVFGGPCDKLIKLLKEEVGNDGFNAFDRLELCSLDIICETVMGIKLNSQAKKHSQYVRDCHTITKIIVSRIFSPLKRFNFTYIFTSAYWTEREVVTRIHSFTNKVIEERRLLRETSTTKDAFNNGTGRNKKLSLMDILLEAESDGPSITSEDIMYEIQTFLYGGHDTTSTVTSSCLYALSKHLEVQDKVFEELQSIFGSDKRHPTWSDLSQMRYLEMVLKETMRLYTPVPLISRLTEEDLDYGDIFIPKGVPVIIYLQGLHMNPEYYPDPEKFDPSRFESKIQPLAFVPFAAGPRTCIGQRFAMLEMKYLICQVLRNFMILPVPGHVPQRVIQIVLKFKNGAMIRLKSR